MTLTLPPHISYSQYNTYTQCPRSWYLGKVRHAQERMTWYLPIGTAVHNMIEDWLDFDHGRPDGYFPSAEKFFYPLISKQLEIEPDMSQWLAGGPEKDPVVEDKALQKVKNCFEKALGFLDDWDVWEVEYNASGRLPGLEVEIKAFVDIVGEYKGKKKKYHGPGILDWKSGSKKPANSFQLETYKALLMNPTSKSYEIHDFSGHWAMLDPNASEARPIDLSAVDPAEVGAKYQKAYNGMKSMQIQAKKKFMCKMCFNQDNCMEYSGLTARTIHYDRSHIDQPKF